MLDPSFAESMMRRTAIRDLGLLLTIAACGGATSEATGTPATNVTVWAGNNQVGFDTVAHLNVPFEARVVDSDGHPRSGVRITWKVTSGAGTLASYPLDVPLTDATTPTGTDGIASVLFRPRVLGLSVVTASAAGTANPPAECRVLTYPAPDRPDVLII